MGQLLFLIIFCLPLFAGTHWDEDQVVDYVHHSELQRRSSWHLLSQMDWKGDENVLDVGCGDGRNTAWIARLVRKGTILGIDPLESMISWARKQYHPHDYPNMTFESGDANHLPSGQFDIITALFSLHIVADKQSAISAFSDHLVDQGYVLATMPPAPNNPEFTKAVSETMQDPTWAPYFKDFKSPFRFEPLNAYVNYFENADFTILHAEDVGSVDPFVNRSEAINWFKGTWPHINYLPQNLHDQFFNALIDRYIQYRPTALSDEGVIYFYWGHYEIIAQKTLFYIFNAETQRRGDAENCLR